jgi:hypothetical protein
MLRIRFYIAKGFVVILGRMEAGPNRVESGQIVQFEVAFEEAKDDRSFSSLGERGTFRAFAVLLKWL